MIGYLVTSARVTASRPRADDAGGHRGHEALADDGERIEPPGRGTGGPDEGHVGRAGPDLLDQPVGVAFHQRDLDARMRQVERGQGVEQRGDGAGRHHPDHDPAGQQPGHVVHRLADRGRGRERGPGVRQAAAPAAVSVATRPDRSIRGAPRSRSSWRICALTPDWLTWTRSAGASEVRVLGDRDEVLQLPQFHNQQF